jgi:sortase A
MKRLVGGFRLETKHLRLFNHGLTAAIALVAIYIIVTPFIPQVAWWLKHDSPVRRVVSDSSSTVAPAKTEAVKGEQLFIDRLSMQETVHGGGIAALKKGVWHLPHTSSPDKGGNTVLVGHRFTYNGQAVFYHLDKVQKGDPITLAWEGKLYRYEVANVKVVPPTEVSIEANTKEPMLTIYTCTPLLTAKDRLVIQAKLIGEPS